VAAQSRQAQSDYGLIEYVRKAVDVSGQIGSAERAVDTASQRLDEVRLAGGTALDIEEASNNVDVAKLALTEARNTVILQAVNNYVSLQRLDRSLAFSRRQLDINRRNEQLAKERFDEGVNTEEAYLGSVSTRLNGELSYLQSSNSLETSRRGLLRYVEADVSGSTSAAGVELPYLSVQYDEDDLLEEINKASSSYLRAESAASIAQRRYDALRRLASSVTQKELETAQLNAETAADSFGDVQAQTADNAWQLLATLAVQEKSVETGEQLLAVSKKTWDKQNEQFEFGLISDLQLVSYELTYDQSRDQAVRRIEDHFLHIMRIEQARGADLLAMLERRMR
jgi:outer membrane protein TolC